VTQAEGVPIASMPRWDVDFDVCNCTDEGGSGCWTPYACLYVNVGHYILICSWLTLTWLIIIDHV